MDQDDQESEHRAKIILLKDDGYTVLEIGKITNHHDNNIRKLIRGFNENGVDKIISKIHKHKSIKISEPIERQIIEIAAKNPSRYNGLVFSTGQLRLLAGFIMKEVRLVDSISHSHIRNIFLKHGIGWRPSKIILDESRDHQYDIKKVHGTVEIQYTFGFLTVVSRGERTDTVKNIRWSFMVAGTIKYGKSAENKRFAQCVWCVRPYKGIPSKDKSGIFTYQIFRIKSDGSRWMWMQRQAVNNSTFENEQDIGKAVTEWIRSYNKKHGKAITNILQEVTIDVFT